MSNIVINIFSSIAKWVSIIVGLVLICTIFAVQTIIFFSHDLPDYQQLADYNPPGITRLYSNNGVILSEYALQHRIFVPISEVPTIIINAFLAAEDKNFFQHGGVDFYSTVRAAVQSIFNLASSKRVVGGSTITQQVVKDFLLTNERSIARKIKEAILAYRISKVYSKKRILELYLNQIFLGNNSYGIAAAAQNYFDKDLKDLDIAEAAMLAALPKAPSTLNPFLNYEKAKIRRDWVIERMAEEDMVTDKDAAHYIKQKINLSRTTQINSYGENFYTETVKQEIIKMFGEDALLANGFIVNTNIDLELQVFADQAFKKGLLDYDKKHGWRGPVDKIQYNDLENWKNLIVQYKEQAINNEFIVAVVLQISNNKATIGLDNLEQGVISFEDAKWARKLLKNQTLGPQVHNIAEILKVGDVVFVSKSKTAASYKLEQVPNVDGGMIAMEPYTGKVLAMVGGYNFKRSFFNRAIQAKRQPGSVFKPFVYLAALEQNIRPNAIVLDEPITVDQGVGMPSWTPKNYGTNFLGPITLRAALEKSRNIPTVRIMLSIGLNKVIEIVNRLGIYDKKNATYSIVLGAFETTLINITNAYNIIASGGLEVKPKFIESIYDRHANLLYRSEEIVCKECNVSLINNIGVEQDENIIPDVLYPAHQLVDSASNYQFISLLEGVMKRGTGAKSNILNKTVAGKTGTTNNSFDTWFIGFTPYITVGLYIGFDKPSTLGEKETGATVALPIFIDFMQNACSQMPDLSFAVPDNIKLQPIDRYSGTIVTDDNSFDIPKSNIIIEAFKRSNDNSYYANHKEVNIQEQPQYNLEEILSLIDSMDKKE